MTTDRIISYVNAPAGSGKTYQAIHWALNEAYYDNTKTVIVLKSKLLMVQAVQDAKNFNKQSLRNMVPIRAINSDNLSANENDQNYNGVKAAILDYLKNAEPNVGEVLLITESAFLQLLYWPKRSAWHCICDEIPDITPSKTLQIPDNHKLITDHLELSPSTPFHSLVSVRKGREQIIKSYAENRSKDEISAYFSEIAKQILSADYDVYTLNSSYNRVMNEDSVNGYYQLQFFSILKPSIFGSGKESEFTRNDDTTEYFPDEFASVTIMGALLTDSLMYYIWPDMGVEFVQHDKISKNLRYHSHACGDRLQIKYLFKRAWSKKFRDQQHCINGKTVSNLDIVLEAIKDEFNSKEFVYLVNKDKEDEVRSALENQNGQQLPNSPFGLNQFQHINQAVILSALNSSPAHYKFLDQFGVDGDAARESMYYQAAYQAIMRTSLRDKDSNEPVKVIVSDLAAAEFLQEQFPGSEVSGIITGIEEKPARRNGRPSKEIKKCRADINRDAKARQKRIRQLVCDQLNGKMIDKTELQQIEQKCRSDNKDLGQLKVLIDSSFSCPFDQKAYLPIPIFQSIHSSKADAHLDVDINRYQEFIDQLRLASKTKLANKRDNVLLSTTSFDYGLSDQTNRGLANIMHIWGIWLDIDGGVMPKSQLPKIFPELHMAVFNSWSSGNYRIFIPTTQYMSVGVYELVIKGIVDRVEQSESDCEIEKARQENRKARCYVSSNQAEKQRKMGYIPNPVHGIDLSKLNPSSMFYMPAQCGDGPSKSFFNEYKGEQRKPLDPNDWAKSETIDTELEIKQIQAELGILETPQMTICALNSDTVKADVIEQAIADYRSVPDGQGRHNAFFTAILTIHRRGKIPISELHEYMSRCDYDDHQRPNYRSILRRLESPNYQW